MKHLLTAVAIAVTLTGIWRHDWPTIIAGAAITLIWPLIRVQVEDVAHQASLDDGDE